MVWVFLLATLAGCQEASAPRPKSVLFAVVQTQDQQTLGQFAGTIQARHQSILAFRVGGRVVRRYVDVGERVVPGTLLAEVDPAEQRTLLQAREGELAELTARYDNARTSAQRQQQLFSHGVGSKSQLERQQTELKTLGATLEQARVAMRQARDRLAYSRLYSDHEGVVIAWYVEAGQTVAAGQNILGSTQSQEREAVVDIPATLVERLPAATQWHISAELLPQSSTTGQVRELSPQVDVNTRSRRVRLRLQDTPSAFRLGSSVQVLLSVPVSTRSNLPQNVVFERNGLDHVWLVDPETLTVVPHEVQVLNRENGRVTIGKGLNTGDLVVAAGLSKLSPGQKIGLEKRVQ